MASRSPAIAVALLLALYLLPLPQGQTNCLRKFYLNGVTRQYQTCQNLGSQGASLAWTYFAKTHRLEVAFSGTAASAAGWVGWGVNPTGWGMVDSSVLVAFQAHNGSNVLPYKLTAATTGGERLVCSPVDIEVLERAVQISGVQMKLFATLQLRPKQTELNMVWNRGSNVMNFSPQPHSLLPQDVRGFRTMDVSMGAV